MVKPTLVIMAAGMGSRFGGMKQITPVGPNGEFIIDYSVYDAVRAGFGKVVLIIKKEHEQQFRDTIGDRISRVVETVYAYQELDNLPEGLDVPTDRPKPWGTAHALYCIRGIVNEPFAVINADDFYGRTAYSTVYDFLTQTKPCHPIPLCMAGYYVENTLTDNGGVVRGLCSRDPEDYLTEITERFGIEYKNDKLIYAENGQDFDIARKTIASMNFFGFMPEALDEFGNYITKVLSENMDNINSVEVLLPSAVAHFIESGKAKVKVLMTDEKWYGVTYAKDKPIVCEAIQNMVRDGLYNERLWENGR